MDQAAFDKNYESIIGKEASSMVQAQVKRMQFSYSLQEIFNGIWYTYVKKGVPIDSIDKYGIGLLTDAKNMEEALGYFRRLAQTRAKAAQSAQKSKKDKPKDIIIKRQKQKVYREEFDWNE